MRFNSLFFALLITVTISAYAFASDISCSTFSITDGTAVIPSHDYLDNRVIRLDGEWSFFPGRLLTADDDSLQKQMVTVPGLWNSYLNTNDIATGFGTYILTIRKLVPISSYAIMFRESPGTACRVFGNGDELCAAGTVAPRESTAVSAVRPLYADVKSSANGEIVLAVQVSNYLHRKGGFWNSCYFSGERTLTHYYNIQTGVSWFVIGMMSFLIVFTLSSFFLALSRRQNLYFAIFIFALMIRIAVSGLSVLALLFSSISLGLELKLEYLGIWLCPIAFLLMLYRTYPDIQVWKSFRLLLVVCTILTGIISLVLPIKYANRLVPVMEFEAVIALFYLLVFLIQALKKHCVMVGIHILTLALPGTILIGNVLFSMWSGIVSDIYLPLMLLLFSVMQFLLLSYSQSRMYQERLVLINDMKKLNNAYLRFVPREFLKLLEKRSMTEVSPGDYVEKKMAISFTQIQLIKHDGSELTPEEQYHFFWLCLIGISPIIGKYHGFISKFVSHGFMALFPDNPMNAVQCCLEIEDKIIMLNARKEIATNLRLCPGTGIHYGKMILGTIGEENRLDDTVISDTVNTASRIESVSERDNKPVVISQEIYDEVHDKLPNTVIVESMGTLSIKGKTKPLALFAISHRLVVTLFLAATILLSFFAQQPLTAQEFYVKDPRVLESETIAIDGPWEFYPSLFVIHGKSGYTVSEQPATTVYIPADWEEYNLGGEFDRSQGAATYHIRITNLKPCTEYAFNVFDKVGTAMRIYVNGGQIAVSGKPSLDWEKTIADQQMGIAIFSSDKDGVADMSIHVSNSFHRIGGIWRSILIGEKSLVLHSFSHNLRTNAWFIGALMIVAIYQMSLFIFFRRNRSSLYLALFCLTIILRVVSAGFSLLKIAFPFFPYTLLLRVEYTSLFAAPLFFALYMYCQSQHLLSRTAIKLIISIGCTIGFFVYFFPIYVGCRMVPIAQVYTICVTAYLFSILLFKFIKTRWPVAGITIVSVLFLLFGSLHDILAFVLLNIFLPNTDLLPYTFVLFVFCQTIITAYQYERSRVSVEKISDRLAKINTAYYRFVPQEFLALLSKKNIVDVQLGESVVKNVTMLSADIRDFTSISESLDGEEVFRLLNKYLMRIAPIIRKHNGFIEKYLGDGIIAIFPENGVDGFACALEMQEEIRALQKIFVVESLPNIQIGIGLHYGKIVLGTVGEEGRMNEVSISKTVEIAMTMESLTKTYKCPILASGTAVEQWHNDNVYTCEKLDNTAALSRGIREDIYSITASVF